MMPGNTKIDLRLELTQTVAALDLLDSVCPLKNITHYTVRRSYGLILLTSEANLFNRMLGEEETQNSNIELLPRTILQAFVLGWLRSSEPENFQTSDSWDRRSTVFSDLKYDKGFRMFNEEWGNVAGASNAVIAFKPVWMWYGK